MNDAQPNHQLLALSLALVAGLGIGCATQQRTVKIRVVNESVEPINSVRCTVAHGEGGYASDLELGAVRTATFSVNTDSADSVVLDVVWQEGAAAEVIDLGEVDSPGATVRLVGPAQYDVKMDH